MPAAPLPPNEAERLAALRSYDILDTSGEAAFDELANLASLLLDTPIALISLVDDDRQWFKARVGLAASETPREQAFCGYAILGGGLFVVPDAAADPRFADNPLVTGAPGIRFYAGAPLIDAEGYALGTLCVIDRQPREMTPEHQGVLVALAHAVSTALELRRTTARLRALSLHDPLTGLGNRQAFVEALEHATARLAQTGEPFSLLMLEVDGLGHLTDTEGYQASDEVLRDTAESIRRNVRVRRGDVLARFGGTVFGALLTGCPLLSLGGVAERLQRAAGASFGRHGDGLLAIIGGVAVASRPHDLENLLARAHLLLGTARASAEAPIALAPYATPDRAAQG